MKVLSVMLFAAVLLLITGKYLKHRIKCKFYEALALGQTDNFIS